MLGRQLKVPGHIPGLHRGLTSIPHNHTMDPNNPGYQEPQESLEKNGEKRNSWKLLGERGFPVMSRALACTPPPPRMQYELPGSPWQGLRDSEATPSSVRRHTELWWCSGTCVPGVDLLFQGTEHQASIFLIELSISPSCIKLENTFFFISWMMLDFYICQRLD